MTGQLQRRGLLRNRRLRRHGLRDVVTAICFVLLCAIGATWIDMRWGESVEGIPRIIDGDSLELEGRELRLRGIDAPEFDQTCGSEALRIPCGQLAKQKLRSIADLDDFRCRLSGHDRYGRDLADCKAGTISVNAEMVRSGFAVAYGSYSHEEAEARRERKGIWEHEFVMPAEWRRGQSRDGAPDYDPAEGFWGFLKRLLGV